MRKTYVTVVVAMVAAAWWGVATARAVTPTAPTAQDSGIGMSPAMQDRALSPSEQSVNFEVTLTNNTDGPLRFAVTTTDFTALNQTGGIAFTGVSSASHGLTSVLHIAAPQVTLAAHSSQKITARIDDVRRLATGGHYAAIVAQVMPSQDQTAKGNKVTINQAVSSLLFLETAGQGTKTLSLLPLQVPKLQLSIPDAVNVVFKATGNTQTVPRGTVDVLHGNALIAHGIINENSSLLLPSSTRLLQTNLRGNLHPWRPGVYRLAIDYRYEGSLGLTHYETTFIYINPWVVLAALGLISLIGAVVLSVWRMRRHLPAQTLPTAARHQLIVVRNASHAAYRVMVKRHPKP